MHQLDCLGMKARHIDPVSPKRKALLCERPERIFSFVVDKSLRHQFQAKSRLFDADTPFDILALIGIHKATQSVKHRP